MDKFWERYIQSRPAPGASKGAFDAFAAAHKEPRITAQEPRIELAGGQLVQPGVGRPGYGGPPVYTVNEANFKLLDDLILNTELTLNEIKVKLGGNEKSGNQGINKLIDAWTASDKDRVVSEKRFRPYKMEGTELSQKIIDASKDQKYIKKDGTPNIKRIAKDFFPEKKLDDARKMVRSILVAGIDYEGKKNIPGEITSAKQAKKNAYENIKIANKKAGIETTKQADQVIDKILSQNEIYQKMSVEDIAKDKNLLKRLRVQIDPVTGNVTFDGYTKKSPVRGKVFSDLELAQHAKNKADTYELFTPDHITPKAWRKQNVGYPINFQSATYMENSQLDNGRRYLMNNPDGNIKPIDNYLKSQNQTIRFGKNKYGFKLPIVFNSKTGTSNIVELSVKKTIPKFKPPVSGGAAIHSFPANLPRMWKMLGSGGRKALGWATAGLSEYAFFKLDMMNEMGKGKSKEEAKDIAASNATLGLYKNKEYMKDLKKTAKDMGIDSQAFEKVYELNKNMDKVQKQHQRYQDIIKNLEAREDSPEKAKALASMKNKYAEWKKGIEKDQSKWTEDVAGQVSISKAGEVFPTPNLDQIAEARYNITEEDFVKPFLNIKKGAFEKLKREKTKAFDVQSKQVDPEAGPIGDPLLTHFFTLEAKRKAKEKERIEDMLAFDPKELYRYNIARGVDPDSPVTTQSWENLAAQHPGLGLASGGIANLTRTVAPDSGPVSQGPKGLASLKKYGNY
jgi:hypothetical protein